VNFWKRPYINAKKEHRKASGIMGRLIKWLFYIVVLLASLLVLYAYIGPFLGVDFSARVEKKSEAVVLQPE
jgi:hypothetical protein